MDVKKITQIVVNANSMTRRKESLTGVQGFPTKD